MSIPAVLAGLVVVVIALAPLPLGSNRPLFWLLWAAILGLLGLAYGIAVSMVTMTIVFLISGMTPGPWFLIYPLLVLPMVLLGTAIGLVLSVLGTIARDLTSFASQALSLVMYITPVIFVRSSIHQPFVEAMIRWNPITYLVDVPRSLICLGHSDNTGVYVAVAAGTLILVIVGLRVFYLLEDLVAERL